MKVTVAQAAAGLDSYIQSEFVGKLQDWRKWAVAAGSGLVKDKAVNIVNALKNNPVAKTMHRAGHPEHSSVGPHHLHRVRHRETLHCHNGSSPGGLKQ